jgi:hypothetical protein
MYNVNRIRLVATNFYNLQGLRAVPLGLCLWLLCLWANRLQGPARDFLIPIVAVIGTLTVLFLIDRFYLHTFGRVQRTPESRHLEWLFSIIGGVLALGAFLLDISFKLPVSLLGLVFAAGLLADYIRITWLVKGRLLLYYPLGATLMIVVSTLQLFGFPNWWQTLGLKSHLLGIVMAIGIFTMLAGLWGHMFLARTLPSRLETADDNSI